MLLDKTYWKTNAEKKWVIAILTFSSADRSVYVCIYIYIHIYILNE